MKAKELRDKSDAELQALEGQVRDELFGLKMQHFTGQLQDIAQLRRRKRDVARIKTVQRERTLADR